MRIIGVLIVVVVIALVWYMAFSQPPKPSVVVVKPANQTPAPVPPPSGGAPITGTPGACQAMYLRLGQTEICGDVITLSKYSDKVYIYAQNVWISGPYTISATACPVSIEGGRYIYKCAVEIYIALGTK